MWSFVQRTTPSIGDAFSLVEEVLQENFLPALFLDLGERTTWRGVTRLPVKQAGMDLPDPMNMASENWTVSCVITGHIVAALRGQEEFQTAAHSSYLR